MNIELDFTGKVAVITGAGSGMGLLASQKFAESGASVAMLDINENAINEEAEKLKAEGYSVLPIKCDVREFDEIKAAVDLAKKTFGRIDYTISFAGGYGGRIRGDVNDLTKVRPDTIQWSLDVNLRAPIYMAMSAFEYLKENGGVVIHLGSITGHDGNAPAYSPAKYGLVAFTKGVAIQGAPYGIRSVCVSPGPVLTREAMANMKTLLGYAAEPIELVRVIMFLCSDNARSITGCEYLVDGGRNVMLNK
ncbi:MAG: SDR family oxidoreductase [Clostridia bacterium]|nr:SDR family oxidoreductase [Clostridia bacterium]